MLYATCSILGEENSEVIQQFLHDQADASVEPPTQDWGVRVAAGQQLLPSPQGPDGLFYALLRKSAAD